MKHLMIPDLQIKPGLDLTYLKWIGKYIVDKKPDVIVQIGDAADMPSLCSYDVGKKSFEGRRYKDDIAAVKEGMRTLFRPLEDYNRRMRKHKGKQYLPRKVLMVQFQSTILDTWTSASKCIRFLMSLSWMEWPILITLLAVFLVGLVLLPMLS